MGIQYTCQLRNIRNLEEMLLKYIHLPSGMIGWRVHVMFMFILCTHISSGLFCMRWLCNYAFCLFWYKLHHKGYGHQMRACHGVIFNLFHWFGFMRACYLTTTGLCLGPIFHRLGRLLWQYLTPPQLTSTKKFSTFHFDRLGSNSSWWFFGIPASSPLASTS